MSPKLLLNSWKEIASFVGRSERTVQRWEKQYGFPVRRPAGKDRSAVIALAGEIEVWAISAPRATGEIKLCSHVNSEERFCPSSELAGKPTVLCIDCHSQKLAMRKAITEFNGFRVLTALDVRAGLRLFNDNQVDVVILEYPDSESITCQLHKSKPEIPILILSREIKQIPQVVLNLVIASGQDPSRGRELTESSPLPAVETSEAVASSSGRGEILKDDTLSDNKGSDYQECSPWRNNLAA